MLVYNGDYVLRECLQSILPYGKVIVAEGAVSYFRDRGYPATSTDNTNAILEEMVGENNIVRDLWDEKDSMMRATIPLVPEDTTHLWMVDSDEVWRSEDIESVKSHLYQWDSVAFKPETFYGGFDRILSGFETSFVWYRIQRWQLGLTWQTHRPPTILCPDDGGPWREHLHWDAPFRFAHYSYVWASQVKSKSEYYSTRSNCIPAYFNDVWLRWVLGNSLTKHLVEEEYDGVHEWIPSNRGECRTVPFLGQHPKVIQDAMPRLVERFNRELEMYR